MFLVCSFWITSVIFSVNGLQINSTQRLPESLHSRHLHPPDANAIQRNSTERLRKSLHGRHFRLQDAVRKLRPEDLNSDVVGDLLNSDAAEDLLIYGRWQSFSAEDLLNRDPAQDFYLHSWAALKRPRDFLEDAREGSSMFYMHTASILFAALGFIAVYSQTHHYIEARTGFKLAHVCCIVYAALSVSIDVSIKNAALSYGGSFPFNPACGVAVVELCKLALSVVLFSVTAYQSHTQGKEILLPTKHDVAWLSIPAVMYAVNNLLVFKAIRSTPLSTFGVARETMLIWNVLIWTLVFQQGISSTRWLAIAGIFFGCTVNQVPKMFNDTWNPGVIWSFLLAFSNACGAVATEYAMKKRAELDINLQNCILYGMCGSLVLIGIAVFETHYVMSFSNFFTGFVPECWQVILLQVLTGLAVSRVLKYVEAVTKTIVAALRGPGVIFLGALAFHTKLGFFEIAATFIVCASCWMYLREGPLTECPKNLSAENPQEAEAPLSVDKRPSRSRPRHEPPIDSDSSTGRSTSEPHSPKSPGRVGSDYSTEDPAY